MENIMPSTYSPKVFAHRGSNTLAPENSKPAFDLSLIEGADGFETDIQFSKDNTPPLFHDGDMSRIGMPEKSLNHFSWEELELLDISLLSNEFHRFCGLMSLNDFIQNYYQKTKLLLELKEIKNDGPKEVENKIQQFLSQLYTNNVNPLSVMISSFEFELLEKVNNYTSNSFLIANIKEAKYSNDISTLKENLPFIKGVCIQNDLVDQKVIQVAKSLDLITLTYTCNKESEILPALESNIDIIISDVPGDCKRIIDKALNNL